MKRYALYLMIMVLLAVPAAARGQNETEGSTEATVSGEATVDMTAGEITAEEVSDEEVIVEDESAEDVDTGEMWGEDEQEEMPPLHYALEPEIRAWAGFRYVTIEGSRRSLEYGWPYSSPTGGIVLHYTPLPHRIDFEIDMLNHYDYDSEVGYAYKDIFKLDYRGWSLYHNLDHELPQPGPTDRNPTADYHLTAMDNRVFLRLKWPDRAYHLFGELRQFERDGTIQQKTDAGGRVAKSREIDWITRRYTAGVNGHFGPVELEFTHRIKTFDPHKEVAPTDIFGGTGPFEHNAAPELRSRSENVKIHTDLTGRIVAAATFVTGNKENNRTHAEVDYNRAHADLVLMPVEHLTVAFKYRYSDLQVDAPEVINDPRRGVVPTEDPIDNRTHQAGVSVRYAPMNELGMKLEYTFRNVQKENVKAWSESVGPGGFRIFPFQDLPYNQNIHTVKVGADLRPTRSLSAKGSLEYSYTQDPAYPVKPRNSIKGRFDMDWIPYYSVNMDTYYRFAREENNTANMDIRRDNIGTIFTWVPMDRLSCFANYDYSRFRNERDIRLVAGAALPITLLPVDNLAYTDASHFYALGMGYGFAIPLTVDAEFHQSWSRGKYRTTVAGGGIGERSDLKIRETGGVLRAGYDFPKGWGVSAEYNVNDYQDLEDKPQNGIQDGLAQSVMVLVKKDW